MEIERKYLVARMPDGLDGYGHVEIEQGYICTSPTLRIRRMGDVFWLTVKEKMGGAASTAIVNREEEFALTADNYRMLKGKCEGRLVWKTRYRVPVGNGLTAEVDIFHGAHEGLQLVEVEFPSIEAADAFVPPAWFGQDVSDRKEYRNSYLAFNRTP